MYTPYFAPTRVALYLRKTTFAAPKVFGRDASHVVFPIWRWREKVTRTVPVFKNTPDIRFARIKTHRSFIRSTFQRGIATAGIQKDRTCGTIARYFYGIHNVDDTVNSRRYRCDRCVIGIETARWMMFRGTVQWNTLSADRMRSPRLPHAHFYQHPC